MNAKTLLMLICIATFSLSFAQLDFKGYRGNDRDGIAPADVGLDDTWSVTPIELWSTGDLGIIGIDHTNGQVAVWNDYAYTTTYKNGKRVVWCIDNQGNIEWSFTTTFDYPGTHAQNPSVWVEDGKVYFSDNSYDYCFDALAGTEVWKTSRAGDQKSSPLVIDGVYVNRQNNDYVGLDASDGSLLWSVPTANGSVGSAVLWKTFSKTYLILTLDENNDISCVDPLTGTILWSVDNPGPGSDGAPNTSPVASKDYLVLTTRELTYGKHQVAYKLYPDNPEQQPQLLWAGGDETVKNTPVIREGHIFWGWTTRHNTYAKVTEIESGTTKYYVKNPPELPACPKGYGDLAMVDGKLFGNACKVTVMAWPNTTELDVIGNIPNNANHNTTPTIVNGKMYIMTYQGYSNGGESVARVKCFDVSAKAGAVPTITQKGLPSGKVGSWYNERLWVSSGNGLRTWSVVSGSLPPGIALDAQQHMLAGHPTTVGTYNFTLKVQDEDGDSDTKAFSIVVSDGTPVEYYTLEVISGSGDGSYPAGTIVDIEADQAVAGQVFASWTGDIQYVGDITSASTTLTMPSENVSVTATYTVAQTYLLTVANGTGSGNYPEGAIVTVGADDPPSGQEFDKWDGDISAVADMYAEVTLVTMPASSVNITALYKISDPCTDCGGESYRYLMFETTSIDGDRLRLSEIEYKENGVSYPTLDMTSENSPVPLVVTSSHEGWQAPWKLYDGDVSNEAFNLGTTTYWNMIDLGEGNEISPSEMVITHGSRSGKNPVDFTVSGSIDLSQWDILLSVTGEPQWDAWSVHSFQFDLKSAVQTIHSISNQLLIYPNPVSDGNLNIEFTQPVNESINIKIYDNTGKVVYFESYNMFETKHVGIQDLDRGVYILQLYNNESVSVHKIVVN